MHACSPIEACSEHGKQHCSNIVQYHWYFFWPVLRSTPEPPTQHTLSWQTSTTSWLSSRLHQSWFTHLEHDVNTQSRFFKFTVTGGGKSFMTPHFSFVMGECGHMAKEQQSFKCKFVCFSLGKKKWGVLGVRTPTHNPPAQTHVWKAQIIPSARQHLQCHLNLPTPESKPPQFKIKWHKNVFPLSSVKSADSPTPSSGLTCVGCLRSEGSACEGECVCLSRCCRIAARRLSPFAFVCFSRAAACLTGRATGS